MLSIVIYHGKKIISTSPCRTVENDTVVASIAFKDQFYRE